MSTFSRALLIVATIFGFAILAYYKGIPLQEAPNPEAITDEVLQPILSVIWGTVGYLFNAAFFGILVTLAVKLARWIVEVVVDPVKFIAAVQSVRVTQKERAQ